MRWDLQETYPTGFCLWQTVMWWRKESRSRSSRHRSIRGPGRFCPGCWRQHRKAGISSVEDIPACCLWLNHRFLKNSFSVTTPSAPHYPGTGSSPGGTVMWKVPIIIRFCYRQERRRRRLLRFCASVPAITEEHRCSGMQEAMPVFPRQSRGFPVRKIIAFCNEIVIFPGDSFIVRARKIK